MTTTLSNTQNGNAVSGVETLLNSLFKDNLHRMFGDDYWRDDSLQRSTVPVNIRETDKEYQIDLIAPGCRKEDFKIDLNEKLLTVAYSYQADNTNEKLVWTRNEYVQPSFNKSFVINDTVDVNNISANYQDGVLRISLGKNAKAIKAVKQIEVK